MMKKLLATALVSRVAAQSDCDSTQVGVNLHDCPLQQWSTRDNPTSEEDPLIMEYRIATHEIPLLSASNDQVIADETMIMQSRTYSFNHDGFTVTLPPPTMIWEKGAVIYMRLLNNIHVDYIDGSDEFFIPEEEWHDEHQGGNIHTHGLHIDSFSDDPSRKVSVNETGDYRFDLPADHGGGMHWYHPHIEQTSELTLSGGGFGALIVETDPDGLEIPQEVVELETVDFVINRFYPAKLLDVADGYPGGFLEDLAGNPRTNVTHPDFKLTVNEELFNSSGMNDSNTNYTLVNGFLKPKIVIQSGEWYRYRFLYVGGHDADAAVSDVKIRMGSNPDIDLHGDESDFAPFTSQADTTCETKLIGKDGVYLRESRDVNYADGDRIWLSPANRAEIMFRCTLSEDVDTDSIDNSLAFITDIPDVNNRAENPKHSLPIIQIEIQNSGSPTTSLGERSSTEEDFDFTVQACLPSYLPDMQDLEADELEVWFEDLTDDERATIRDSTFDQDVDYPWYDEDENAIMIEVTPFSLNGDQFAGYDLADAVPNLTVMHMQRVYQFIQSHGDHPLHIHVNHMQLVDPSADGSNYHLPGDYIDTLSAPCPAPDDGDGECLNSEPRPGEHVRFRMFTDRFFDRVLMHCHIMDHSDNLAVAQMFILEDEDYLSTFEPPEWQDNCGDEMTLQT